MIRQLASIVPLALCLPGALAAQRKVDSYQIGTAPSVGGSGGVGGADTRGQQVQPSGAPRASRPVPRPALYDVFEPDGRYLGQVPISANATLVTARGDRLWTIALDDNDVSSIKRYHIRWR